MTARATRIKLMDQVFTREDTMHAWYDEAGGEVHPFDRYYTRQQEPGRLRRQIFLGDGRAP